jgi:hypothetical protein
MKFFREFWQESSYISASDVRILDQRPDLERLLDSTSMLLRQSYDLRTRY